MEYCSADEGNEVLIPAAMWMSLENIMLHERKLAQRTTHYVIPFISNVKNRQNQRTANRLSVA